jgi:hypothetical protein
MGLHRRPEIARFLAKAYETLQFKANKTAALACEINAVMDVQAGLIWQRAPGQQSHHAHPHFGVSPRLQEFATSLALPIAGSAAKKLHKLF